MANDGDTVKVHYTGTLEDGTIFDTSREREPLEFTLGEGQLIPGFEEAVRGMRVGQVKTATIPVEEAYGPHRDDLVMIVERDQLPENMEPGIGEQLQMQEADGRTTVFVVTDVSETSITVDANHPLAGKDLTFEIELVEIK
ncbi:peptidylprolyl isomerase [Chloroflexota bacterium]